MYTEVGVSNKRHARIRIWAFACERHQPPDPHLISESYFPYSSAATLSQVGSLLRWSQHLVGLCGKESASQCRRQGFDHWAGRIENAEEQLSLGTTATEPEP